MNINGHEYVRTDTKLVKMDDDETGRTVMHQEIDTWTSMSSNIILSHRRSLISQEETWIGFNPDTVGIAAVLHNNDTPEEAWIRVSQ